MELRIPKLRKGSYLTGGSDNLTVELQHAISIALPFVVNRAAGALIVFALEAHHFRQLLSDTSAVADGESRTSIDLKHDLYD